jgi:hypothetical protein
MNGINLAAVEARRRFRVHFTMWEADRSGDVEGDVGIAAARVDRDDAPRSYSARICAHSDGDRGDLAREAFSPPNPFFSRKRRRRDRSVDVIALSPIGVRAIGDEPFISLHEFTHNPKRAFDIDFRAFDIDF